MVNTSSSQSVERYEIERAVPVLPSQLERAPWSRKKLNELEQKSVDESLDWVGQVQEIVARPHPTKPGQYQIIDGKHRVELLQKQRPDVPVYINVIHGLSDPEAQKLTIVMDVSGGELQQDDLSIMLAEIAREFGKDDLLTALPYTSDGLDELLALGGFDWNQFEAELNGAGGEPGSGKQENEEEVADLLEQAEQNAIAPRTKLGEIWRLGAHRLIVGDATSATDIQRLMDGQRAVLCWTDPPYNVNYDPEQRHSHFSPERTSSPLGKIANDKMSDPEFREFLDKVYTNINEALEPGCPIYISHADTMGHHFRNAFVAQPWKMQSCLIWKKTVLVFGRADYHWMHEPILYGWKEGAPHRYYGDRKQTTILEFAAPHYDKGNCDTEGYVHPTQKPTTLIEACLRNSSRPGEIVLDLFGGSGSTLIACEKTGRAARLSEIDPKFATVILIRWENLTGQTAELIESA